MPCPLKILAPTFQTHPPTHFSKDNNPFKQFSNSIYMKVLKREISRQFIRFCLIGLECTVLYYLVFILLYNYLSFHYLTSALISFLSGIFFGFAFNKIFTFNSKEKNTIAFPTYFLVYLFSMIFTLVSLKLLVDFLKINPLISFALLIPITTLINFLGTKIFVFKNKKW